AAPARRLWSFLVRQESVQDTFIRAVFGKRRSLTQLLAGETAPPPVDTTAPTHHPALPEPVRIIHKEQDSISAFCLNEVSSGLLALATPREVQEMDISLLLESPAWLEDECEFDIVNLSKEPDLMPASSFLVIQTAADRPLLNHHSPNTTGNANGYGSSSTAPSGLAGQSGRGASVIKGLNFPGSHDARFCQFVLDRSRHMLRPVHKHKADGIRRISAHPLLPVYVTGSQDGSVSMWEWGHNQQVAQPREAGSFAKVTRVRFSQHGNKFGVTDGDGHLSLFQAGLGASTSMPFYRSRHRWSQFRKPERGVVGHITATSQVARASLATMQPYFMFPGEHARSSFFKNIGQGVTQLHVDSACRLFSCGADGSMKVRQLPERESAVATYY
ncbi:hypothetical protein B566_EDAN009302, partial [Ephemera danica]